MSTTRSITTSNEKGSPKSPREGSVIWAVIEVLTGKRKPMKADEIYAEIRERKLAKGLAGKTPVASVAAALAVHTARGLYVERPEPGKYQLKKGVHSTSTSKGSRSKRTDARSVAEPGS